jgi:hypothetical protein
VQRRHRSAAVSAAAVFPKPRCRIVVRSAGILPARSRTCSNIVKRRLERSRGTEKFPSVGGVAREARRGGYNALGNAHWRTSVRRERFSESFARDTLRVCFKPTPPSLRSVSVGCVCVAPLARFANEANTTNLITTHTTSLNSVRMSLKIAHGFDPFRVGVSFTRFRRVSLCSTLVR